MNTVRRAGIAASIKYRLLIFQYHNSLYAAARLYRTMHAYASRPTHKENAMQHHTKHINQKAAA